MAAMEVLCPPRSITIEYSFECRNDASDNEFLKYRPEQPPDSNSSSTNSFLNTSVCGGSITSTTWSSGSKLRSSKVDWRKASLRSLLAG